jgi:hypothetical protein
MVWERDWGSMGVLEACSDKTMNNPEWQLRFMKAGKVFGESHRE